MCTIHSLRITVRLDISTVPTATMVQQIHCCKGGIWSVCALKIVSGNDLHEDKLCASPLERKVLVKDTSPQQLRTPMSIWWISWKSEHGAPRSSKEQFNPPILYLFIVMSKLQIFPEGDFHTFVSLWVISKEKEKKIILRWKDNGKTSTTRVSNRIKVPLQHSLLQSNQLWNLSLH